mmetsp:Transcript_36548/g.91487  ORF Transcript_36548/g.91487 Transcript_36548/m.91487 type:complete len:218 (+) Transcript_36548:1073-1726(+)
MGTKHHDMKKTRGPLSISHHALHRSSLSSMSELLRFTALGSGHVGDLLLAALAGDVLLAALALGEVVEHAALPARLVVALVVVDVILGLLVRLNHRVALGAHGGVASHELVEVGVLDVSERRVGDHALGHGRGAAGHAVGAGAGTLLGLQLAELLFVLGLFDAAVADVVEHVGTSPDPVQRKHRDSNSGDRSQAPERCREAKGVDSVCLKLVGWLRV